MVRRGQNETAEVTREGKESVEVVQQTDENGPGYQ
jgi:hypothetical protein